MISPYFSAELGNDRHRTLMQEAARERLARQAGRRNRRRRTRRPRARWWQRLRLAHEAF